MMVVGVLLVMLVALVGCGGGAGQPRVRTLTYRPGLPLHARAVDGGRDGALRLEQITYRSADGERVPALFAVPTNRKPLGCLVYQGDLGQTKEQGPGLREGAAALRLATFAIDPRNEGARGSPAQALAAIARPETLRDMVLDTVVDVRVGLDYLERRPECRHRIGFAGMSFGALVGTLLAAQDPRIKAVVLTSLGATFKQGLLLSNLAALNNPDAAVMVPGAGTDPKLLAHAVSILGPYDPAKWVGKISPRPLMLINGRFDPSVLPIDTLELSKAARDPKTVLYVDAGHDPFAPGPQQRAIAKRVARFLRRSLGLTASS
jgi:dienelactone hydrolase